MSPQFRLSVSRCRLWRSCTVHPTQRVEIFANIFTPSNSLGSQLQFVFTFWKEIRRLNWHFWTNISHYRDNDTICSHICNVRRIGIRMRCTAYLTSNNSKWFKIELRIVLRRLCLFVTTLMLVGVKRRTTAVMPCMKCAMRRHPAIGRRARFVMTGSICISVVRCVMHNNILRC